MDCFTFLDRAARGQPLPIYVVHGDEDFLKRQVLAALKKLVLGDDPDSMGYSAHQGDKAEYAAVHDELETLPFLSPRRLVEIENADTFVTKFRSSLENYVKQPSVTGTLVLDVKTWMSTTKLAKAVDANATIVCKAPAAYKMAEWVMKWAVSKHGKQITDRAAGMLVDLIGAEMGLLDQELEKLAIYVGDAARIDVKDVDQLVGSSRAESTWKIFDAIGAGQSKEALQILERLFDQGEDAMRVLGAFSMQLRRLAQAARLNSQGKPVPAALSQLGVQPWAQKGIEQQLRHLGRRRLNQLYDWLLETDSGMKGGSQLPERLQLERLVVRLARKNSN